ncbi:Hypothetical predicted protein [Octopus vulgaris]|uniref:Uncharacterized protein n=1 Tax=Octopus vulgaris TaxID=6645 RepID=A0AA36BV57_OCTVU|nr:Hypothetical predicted protein [Octopus vulgaris]
MAATEIIIEYPLTSSEELLEIQKLEKKTRIKKDYSDNNNNKNINGAIEREREKRDRKRERWVREERGEEEEEEGK